MKILKTGSTDYGQRCFGFCPVESICKKPMGNRFECRPYFQCFISIAYKEYQFRFSELELFIFLWVNFRTNFYWIRTKVKVIFINPSKSWLWMAEIKSSSGVSVSSKGNPADDYLIFRFKTLTYRCICHSVSIIISILTTVD